MPLVKPINEVFLPAVPAVPARVASTVCPVSIIGKPTIQPPNTVASSVTVFDCLVTVNGVTYNTDLTVTSIPGGAALVVYNPPIPAGDITSSVCGDGVSSTVFLPVQ